MCQKSGAKLLVKFNISKDGASALNQLAIADHCSDRICGNTGFKSWFRPVKRCYHSEQTVQICQNTKIASMIQPATLTEKKCVGNQTFRNLVLASGNLVLYLSKS